MYNIGKPKYIFLTGAHGVGKTTLGSLMAKKFGYTHAPSIPRLIAQKWGKCWRVIRANPKDFLKFQMEIADYLYQYVKQKSFIIVDRYFTDIAAYTLHAQLGVDFVLSLLENFEKDHANDAILLYFGLKNSYVKTPTNEQIEIDKNIQDFLKFSILPVIKIGKGTVIKSNDISVTV